jgi:(2Fe-2S) ferredoxin
MNSPQYRVFVCTKQRSVSDPDGCCSNLGGLQIYQAFQAEIAKQQIGDRVQVRKSGCLDCCQAGAVALVHQPQHRAFSWLPSKLRLKLRHFFMPKRFLYGHLTAEDIPAIVRSHFIKGQPLERCQISTHQESE